jgi:hypothetical protein
LGRPNLSITHPRAGAEAAKTQHFALRVQTREAIAARFGIGIGDCLSLHASSSIREAAVKENDMQYRNARLRRKIDGALKTRPELEPVVNGVALKQPANPSLEQVQANLQERARAIIAAKPELDGYFDL